MKYSISRYEQGRWIWLADGDTGHGCFGDLPDAVLEFADAGGVGEIWDHGETYRIEAGK